MSELPDGWEPARLPEVCELNPGKPEASTITLDTQVTFVPMAAVDAGLGRITNPTVRPYAEVSKGFTAFQENDVILAKITPCMENGKAAIARGLSNGIGFGSTEFHVFRHSNAILPEYLFYFIRQDSFRKSAEASMTGSVGQKRVPVDFLKETLLPLPPLREQRRIVAKLERLLSRVDATQARLATIPHILKRFRQSVLAAACSGRLTSDWRDIEEGPEELPRSWSDIEFGNLIADGPHNGLYKPQSFYGSGTPIVRIDAFYDGRITNWAELKRLQISKNEREQFALADGDILINRVNSPKFLGKSVHIQMMPEASVYESNMMRLRLDGSRATPNYTILYLRSAQGLEELRKNAKHAVNQSSINQQDVKAVTFALPPLKEQQEIVRRVEAIFKTADALEARYCTAKAHVDKLTQSILAKAFRGELVPQDPNDEPASALLERIGESKNEPGDKKQRRQTPHSPRVKQRDASWTARE